MRLQLPYTLWWSSSVGLAAHRVTTAAALFDNQLDKLAQVNFCGALLFGAAMARVSLTGLLNVVQILLQLSAEPQQAANADSKEAPSTAGSALRILKARPRFIALFADQLLATRRFICIGWLV